MTDIQLKDFENLKTTLQNYGEEYNYELIYKAFELCINAHEGQKRISGEDYYYHPFNVAKIVISLGMDSESIAASLLHDVVEDTNITFENLLEMGFPQEVINVLKLLTHEDSVPYMDYVKNISLNPIAKKVKIADLLHNSDVSRLDFVDEYAVKRNQKYQEALRILTN